MSLYALSRFDVIAVTGSTTTATSTEGGLLLERESELAAFDRALDRAVAGEGSMLLVEGPAGIGKTRLLAEFARFASKRDVPVLTTRGGPLEREMSFGLARLLLEPVIERSSEAERTRLLAGSAEFAQLWERHDVQTPPPLQKTFRYTPAGPITVNCDSLAITERDQHLVLYTAPAGSRDAEKLALLEVIGSEPLVEPRGT